MGAKQNPKAVRALKDGKIPYEYLVLSVLEDDAHVHKSGGDKYGIRNWTIDEILASTYVGAMFRHYKAWCEGEDLDPESGRPHLSHLRACCAVVLDGQKHGKLVDDRGLAQTRGPDGEVTKTVDLHAPPADDCYAPTSQPPERECMYVVQFCDDRATGNWKYTSYEGPFLNVEDAEDHARTNPSCIAGVKTIHAINKP